MLSEVPLFLGGVRWLPEIEQPRTPEQETSDTAVRAEATSQAALPPAGRMGPSNAHLLRKHRVRVKACVGPYFVNNPHAGLEDVMDASLYSYSVKRDALTLAYQDVCVRSRSKVVLGRVHPGLLVDGTATVMLYNLAPGHVVCGYVSSVSNTSLSVLAMGGAKCWLTGGAAGDYSGAIFRGDVLRCTLLSLPVAAKEAQQQAGAMFNAQGSLVATDERAAACLGLHDWQPEEQLKLRQRLNAPPQQDAAAAAAAGAANGGGEQQLPLPAAPDKKAARAARKAEKAAAKAAKAAAKADGGGKKRKRQEGAARSNGAAAAQPHAAANGVANGVVNGVASPKKQKQKEH